MTTTRELCRVLSATLHLPVVDRLVAAPGYAAMPSSGKAKAIRQIISETREAAKKAFLVANPDFLRRAARRRVDLITAP